jgi:hypothetical protein
MDHDMEAEMARYFDFDEASNTLPLGLGALNIDGISSTEVNDEAR